MVRIFIHRLRNEEIAGMMRVPFSFRAAKCRCPNRVGTNICGGLRIRSGSNPSTP